MSQNKTIATIVPQRIVEIIESLVSEGRYRSKSDFLYQALLKKLDEEGLR
ncbi:MAG: hypothetical protein ACE5HW_06465 [Candidatus Methanofastidiosia archaeon]